MIGPTGVCWWWLLQSLRPLQTIAVPPLTYRRHQQNSPSSLLNHHSPVMFSACPGAETEVSRPDHQVPRIRETPRQHHRRRRQRDVNLRRASQPVLRPLVRADRRFSGCGATFEGLSVVTVFVCQKKSRRSTCGKIKRNINLIRPG